MRALLSMFLVFMTSIAWAQWKPLEQASVNVTTAPISDPVPGGRPVAYFDIRGADAKALYEGMKQPKVTSNFCGEKGMLQRRVGNLACTKHANDYACIFGVGLQDGRLYQDGGC